MTEASVVEHLLPLNLTATTSRHSTARGGEGRGRRVAWRFAGVVAGVVAGEWGCRGEIE